MVKIFRIKGEVLGKDEPMVFTKEYRALKEEHALELMYSEIGSKHRVRRRMIKVHEVKEISEDEVTDPILKKMLAMY
ncbi:50S ribosomal protein L18Ae [Methanotorris igneus]|uniref:Large ribosomal subunit protein eL20 n=1 Tax=Methanotorris igneus (strain DSM 5666 / JCM 11834 / Kol 5) TaxID=880724 RepID=F6BEN1_METIK|nr:50S ribosomal protein L18Ae [Methanotorris igneus]AEF96828.1 50S ribosomal protein LX [Methanotorris igneus Kol 5]